MEQNNNNLIDDSTFPSHLTDGRMVAGERKEAPKNLRSLHFEILRLSLLGWKGTDIARHLGISPVTVSNCLASQKGKSVLLMLQNVRTNRAVDIRKDIQTFAPIALKVAQEITSNGDVHAATRLRGAELCLGLAGFVKPHHIQSQSVQTHLTLDEIEELKARARDRAKASGLIVESNQAMEPIGDFIDVEFDE